MADRLDERLAGALGQAGGPSISSGDLAAARAALVGELRRRRARHLAGGAAVLVTAVLGVGSWVAVRWWPSGPGTGRSTAATASPAGAARGPSHPACAQVVGTSRCVGTVSAAPKSATEFGPAARSALHGAANAPGAGLGQTLDLRVGRSATLVLPSDGGPSWGQPHLGRAGAPSSAGGGLVRIGRVARAGQGGSAHVQTVTVAAIRPGTVEVVAGATCPGHAVRSGCAARLWTVEVVVSR